MKRGIRKQNGKNALAFCKYRKPESIICVSGQPCIRTLVMAAGLSISICSQILKYFRCSLFRGGLGCVNSQFSIRRYLIRI